MHSMDDAVIVAAARTPFGKLGGGHRTAGICSGMAQGEATIVRVDGRTA